MKTSTSKRIVKKTLIVLLFSTTALFAQPHVYWADFSNGTIGRADLSENIQVNLLAGLAGPVGLAVDSEGGKIYWTHWSDGTIRRSNLDGSGSETVLSGQAANLRSIVLDTDSGLLYWSEQGNGIIGRAGLDGSGPVDLIAGEGTLVGGLALDLADGKIYWGVNDTIRRANLDGTGIETVVADTGGVVVHPALDLISGKVYWTESSTFTVRRANLDGTGAEILVPNQGNQLRGIALDLLNGRMYWSWSSSNNVIRRADLDGSNVEDVVTGLAWSQEIALVVPEPASHAFTYQGELQDGGLLGDGLFDFEFSLHSTSTLNSPVGSSLFRDDVPVAEGRFTVQLDFGRAALDGNRRWLEITIRPGASSDPNAFIVLSPRQELTATPMACLALKGSYVGLAPVDIDNMRDTIGLNPATTSGNLMTWDGNNWVALPPAVQHFNFDNMQPWLGVHYIIALQGLYPSGSSESPFIAEIILFGGNFAPDGWAFCDGQLLSIAPNTALFSLLGTTYGGDGETNFGLPDLRGRVPVHPGSGPGLSNRQLGQKGGIESHAK